MSIFAVTLPDSARAGVRFANAVIVNAVDNASALARAKDAFDGDANTMWDTAVVYPYVELNAVAQDSMPQWGCRLTINTDPQIDISVLNEGPGFNVAWSMVDLFTVSNGGTGYVVGDVLTATIIGRPGKVRVTSAPGGVVDGLVVVDPMDLNANNFTPMQPTLSGGSGSGVVASFNATPLGWHTLWAQLLTALLAQSAIANAEIDVSLTPPKLTIAGAADNLGDRTVTVEVLAPVVGNYGVSSQNPLFLGTLTHEGSVGAALELEFTDPSTFVVPLLITSFFQ